MIQIERAKTFASEWIEAWNSHNIKQIINLYADDIIIHSPIAEKLLGNAEVRGKNAVHSYFLKGLDAYPDLHFEILDLFYGEASIVLFYRNQKGDKAAECMFFDDVMRIKQMYAHYSFEK